jgi:hypothetical protein
VKRGRQSRGLEMATTAEACCLKFENEGSQPFGVLIPLLNRGRDAMEGTLPCQAMAESWQGVPVI